MLYKTSLGMNIRAVGENPNAAASVGVSVLKIKYTAIAYSGLMAGFGGAFMSMSYAQGWSLDMVAGRGFIALAAQAMGSGECLGGMLSSLVFGFAQALGIKFSARGLDSNLASPIPYAVTIIGLVVFSLIRRSRIKKAARNDSVVKPRRVSPRRAVNKMEIMLSGGSADRKHTYRLASGRFCASAQNYARSRAQSLLKSVCFFNRLNARPSGRARFN